MNAQNTIAKQTTVSLSPNTLLYATGIDKSFTLHNQGGIKLPVLNNASLEVKAGESGSGKSTLMKSLYGNYGVDGAEI